jgi:hypothetical protein
LRGGENEEKKNPSVSYGGGIGEWIDGGWLCGTSSGPSASASPGSSPTFGTNAAVFAF